MYQKNLQCAKNFRGGWDSYGGGLEKSELHNTVWKNSRGGGGSLGNGVVICANHTDRGRGGTHLAIWGVGVAQGAIIRQKRDIPYNLFTGRCCSAILSIEETK